MGLRNHLSVAPTAAGRLLLPPAPAVARRAAWPSPRCWSACACPRSSCARAWTLLCSSCRACPGARLPPARRHSCMATLMHGDTHAWQYSCMAILMHAALRGVPCLAHACPCLRAHTPRCEARGPHVQPSLKRPAPCRDLKRHMLAAEERCLERLAWQPGSSLYPALAAAVGAQGAATGSGSDASVPAPMDAAAGSASGQQHPARQQRPTGSQGAADSSGRQAASEAAAPGQQMQAAVAATPNGADAEDAASMDEGATSVSPQQPPPVQQRPAQQQPAEAHGAQPGLPLCLGQEPPAAAAAGTAPGSGGSEPQREVSTAAAPPRGDRAARAAVADFLRRVLKLAAIRLADLVGRLDTEPADPQQLLAEVRQQGLLVCVAHRSCCVQRCRHCGRCCSAVRGRVCAAC